MAIVRGMAQPFTLPWTNDTNSWCPHTHTHIDSNISDSRPPPLNMRLRQHSKSYYYHRVVLSKGDAIIPHLMSPGRRRRLRVIVPLRWSCALHSEHAKTMRGMYIEERAVRTFWVPRKVYYVRSNFGKQLVNICNAVFPWTGTLRKEYMHRVCSERAAVGHSS